MININTVISYSKQKSKAVQYAVKALERDIRNTCGETGEKGSIIEIIFSDKIPAECFELASKDDGEKIEISASEDLGFIYGIYYISKKFLGVNEFWFWNEQCFQKKEGYEIPKDYYYASKPYPIRFRGWFVNDEVLIDSWQIDGSKEKPWEMAFEALLRCGGNMTIPGTDENAHIYNQLASDMGLWITHHHAEPMGAQMFARAYPDLDASYDKYPELFEGLWEAAIDKQKDFKVIWNLGFRGQGDRPFWADDPAYDTDEKRGALISSLIRKQYDMIKERDKDAICCSNLYGEIMELYRKGLLDIPEDVIFIWADNGFGKMVSRRQGNHNPRVPAIPEEGAGGKHGIYYHASFYDLQAAAQMTMLPNSPEFVAKELSKVCSSNMKDFWIINCSNIKPHAYYLDLIANIWREQDEVDTEELRLNYCREYFGEENAEQIAELYRLWPKYCPSYGPNEDDHAGEQFTNHGARVLTTAFVTDFKKDNPAKTRAADEWLWFSNSATLKEQINKYIEIIRKGLSGYEEYLEKCNLVAEKLSDRQRHLLDDLLIWQVEYHYYSYLGALHTCNALLACLVEVDESPSDSEGEVIDCISQGRDKEGSPDYLKGFYEAGCAANAFRTGYEQMRSHENGVFKGFYNNDCEADIRQSYYVAKGLMSFMRFLGDGPHFYKWQRMYQQGAGGNKVHLILRIKKHLTDEELWELMK